MRIKSVLSSSKDCMLLIYAFSWNYGV